MRWKMLLLGDVPEIVRWLHKSRRTLLSHYTTPLGLCQTVVLVVLVLDRICRLVVLMVGNNFPPKCACHVVVCVPFPHTHTHTHTNAIPLRMDRSCSVEESANRWRKLSNCLGIGFSAAFVRFRRWLAGWVLSSESFSWKLPSPSWINLPESRSSRRSRESLRKEAKFACNVMKRFIVCAVPTRGIKFSWMKLNIQDGVSVFPSRTEVKQWSQNVDNDSALRVSLESIYTQSEPGLRVRFSNLSFIFSIEWHSIIVRNVSNVCHWQVCRKRKICFGNNQSHSRH